MGTSRRAVEKRRACVRVCYDDGVVCAVRFRVEACCVQQCKSDAAIRSCVQNTIAARGRAPRQTVQTVFVKSVSDSVERRRSI